MRRAVEAVARATQIQPNIGECTNFIGISDGVRGIGTYQLRETGYVSVESITG